MVKLLYAQGHVRLLFWIAAWAVRPTQKNNIERLKELCFNLAARQGNIPLLKWCKENEFAWTLGTIKEAIVNSQIEALEWMNEDFGLYGPMEKWAVRSNNPEVVKWLRVNCHISIEDVARAAAAQGNIKMLKRFYVKGLAGTRVELVHPALRSGNLDVLNFLKEKKETFAGGAWLTAGLKNHVHVLQWLKDQGCRGLKKTKALEKVASKGCLEATQWFLEENCLFDYNSLTTKAASSGNLQLVQFLVERGFPLFSSAFEQACLSGNLELCKWIESQGLAKPKLADKHFWAHLSHRKHKSVLQWLEEH